MSLTTVAHGETASSSPDLSSTDPLGMLERADAARMITRQDYIACFTAEPDCTAAAYSYMCTAAAKKIAEDPKIMASSMTWAIQYCPISCSKIVTAFDTGNSKTTLIISSRIRSVLYSLDNRYIGKGQPSVILPLSTDGYEKIAELPIEYCRKAPTSTLGKETINMYNGLRGMNKTFKTIP